jgi:hypothetical protein
MGAWRGQETAPGKNLHFGGSKVGIWVYTDRHPGSKMEIPVKWFSILRSQKRRGTLKQMTERSFSLAVSVQSDPGVHALLIGSGVSRSSGVPTGWEIVAELIRRLSKPKGEEWGNDPQGRELPTPAHTRRRQDHVGRVFRRRATREDDFGNAVKLPPSQGRRP